MKRRLEILMVLAAVVFCLAGLAEAVEPVSHWKLDEPDGLIAYDSVGGNDGTLMNGPVWTAGWIDGALLFDGVDDYVSLPENAVTGTEFTVTAWANQYGVAGGYWNQSSIFSQRDDAIGDNHCSVGFMTERIEGGPAAAGIRSSDGPTQALYYTRQPYGEWHHYAMTVDAENFIFYIDGVAVGSTANLQNGDYITNIDHVDIGRHRYITYFVLRDTGFFNGVIDDVRVYDGALSDEEIQQLYEEGLPDVVGLGISGPDEAAEDSVTSYKATAYYDNSWTKDVTDEAAWSVEPNVIADIEAGLLTTEKIFEPEELEIYAEYTEDGNTFGASKTVSVFAICPEGTALEFDGVDDYVNLSENAVTTTEFTIAAWANQYGEGGGAEKNNRIFTQRDNSVGDNHSGIGLHTDNGSHAAAGIRSDSGSTQVLYAPKKDYNEWHHYAMTVGAADFIFYIDGIEADRTSNNQAGVYTTSIDHVYIGRYMYSGSLKGSFNGAMDDVRIYDRALSAEEVQVIMHTRPAVDEPNLVGYWDFDEGEGQVAYDTSGSGNDGQLGSSPDIDDSDPNWVDSDAPIGICTLEGLVERNVNEALEIKLNILDEILEALAREDASVDILGGLFGGLEYGYLNKTDIVRARQEIHSAIQSEEQATHSIEKSVGNLEDSLDILASEDGPPDNNSPNENRLTERKTVQSGK